MADIGEPQREVVILPAEEPVPRELPELPAEPAPEPVAPEVVPA